MRLKDFYACVCEPLNWSWNCLLIIG